jgi:hypothetical protein
MNKTEPLGNYPTFLLLIAVVAAFGLSGCAGTQVQNKESLLLAAGFQKRTPSTQEQWAIFNRMTPYKLERNTVRGSALYTYADKRNGIFYVGGDKAYQSYRQLALQQSIAQSEIEAAYSNQLSQEQKVLGINGPGL